MKLNRIAEQRIRQAEAEGKLAKLKGAGKPLPPGGGGDFAEEAGFRVMRDAGALPREIELRKAVDAQRAHLATVTDPDERKPEMAKLADLELRLQIEVEARRKFYSTR